MLGRSFTWTGATLLYVHFHTFFRVLIGLIILAGAATVAYHYKEFDLNTIEAWIYAHQPWSQLLFILAYVVSAIFLLPASFITLLGGAAFGPVLGTVLNLIGAVLGAACSFLIARYLAADLVRQHAGPRLSDMLEGVRGKGWRFIAFVRLVPLFPYFVVNYALGLTPLHFRTYVWATAVFMVPSLSVMSYLGWAGKNAVAGGDDALTHLAIAGTTMGLLIMAPEILRRLKGKKD